MRNLKSFTLDKQKISHSKHKENVFVKKKEF